MIPTTLKTDITKPNSLRSTRRASVKTSLGDLNQAEQQDKSGERMIDSNIELPTFRVAELRSECARVKALLSVFASLLATLVLSRGIMSLMQEHRGTAWPFAVLLAAITAYEVVWLKFVTRAIDSDREISTATWTGSIFIESLLPTIAVSLQLYTAFPGPGRALTSPVVLAYFIFIVLSTLHLSPHLSRLTGVFAATGYAAVSIYAFLLVPEAVSSDPLWDYTISFSYSAFMLIGGFAAGSVAAQIQAHVIVALDEARGLAKLEQDLSLARTIQQGLLPKESPKIDGFDINGWNKPADETGGDYFDWQQLADGRLAVMIADVTGHGIGPAIGMAGCRAYARAGFAAVTDLRRFLIHINDLLHDDLPADKFVTMAAGLLSPREATLDLISAGHGPLLFYSSQEDRFSRYDPQGPPLGVFPGCPYAGPHTLNFIPGDILMLVTDGFVEWANAGGEEFGPQRIEEVIRRCRDMSSERIILELYSAVVRFVGSTPQLDDLTALVVKRV